MLVASSPTGLVPTPLGRIPYEKTFTIVTPVALIGLSAPEGVPDRQSSDPDNGSRRWVPSGGWSGSEDPFRPPGGSNRSLHSVRSAFPSGLLLLESFAAVPSGSVVRPAEAGLPSFLPGRGDSANGCAPLTASAVRQVRSEKLTRRVFRRCCGHRCRFVQVEFLQLFQGFIPSREGRFFPSDDQRLRPRTESRKNFL